MRFYQRCMQNRFMGPVPAVYFLLIFFTFAVGCERASDSEKKKSDEPVSTEYIFGYWPPDGYYYGARVLDRSEKGIRVLYGDGSRRLVNAGSRSAEIPTHATVEALWKNNKYYALKSWKQEDMVVHIVYKDEVAETVSLEQIRFKLPDEAD